MSDNMQKYKEMRSGLYSSDSRVLASTLQEVQKSGSSALIPDLITLLKRTDKQEVTDQILTILNNLKYQSSAEELVKAIRQTTDTQILTDLVTACWKNGLNYTVFIDEFIELFINADYYLAFEAFTVIENATEKLDPATTESNISHLKNHLGDMSKEKQILMRELIQVLYSKKNED